MKSPVVFLHGFAGHADSWRGVRAEIQREQPTRKVTAITLFGHDPAVPAQAPTTFEDEVTRVTAEIRGVGQPVRLCGYSMGGRIAFGVLARAPELVRSALVIGAHPGLDSDSEREERKLADEVWAQLLEREGMEAFVEKWAALPLFATQAALSPEVLAEQRRIRLGHDAPSLARAMRSLSLAAMPSWWSALEANEVPVDLVVGALDAKFGALARKLQDRMKRARVRVVSVADVTHNVVLEDPAMLAELV